MHVFTVTVCVIAIFVCPRFCMDNSLPTGFVYLKDVDSTILQSVRYAHSENFLGRPVCGYHSPIIILTRTASEALKKVQATIQPHGYSLVVYDGYRPQHAVDSFITWSEDTFDQIAKPLYYPTVAKTEAFELGYIARQSGHTRGSTVDLSIISLNKTLHPVIVSQRILRNGESIPFLDDGTVDMGSSFDLFHGVSSHDTPLITDEATQMRNFLRNALKGHGFQEYDQEWWHYTLQHETHPDTYFDFPVLSESS